MTKQLKKGFGSDNHSGVLPEVFEALAGASAGHEPAYGTDEYCEKARRVFKENFADSAEVYFVFNGTAANVLSLMACAQSFNSVIVSDISHLNEDECGAPEANGGFKLVSLPSINGKISADQIEKKLIRSGDQHYSQVKVVSITQPTEVGTLYTIEEMTSISQLCKANGLFFHVDGARFIYSAQALGKSFRDLTAGVGVDVLSFGGTKNGLLGTEAVVILNPALNKNFQYLRKQRMQLASKSRFHAVQWLEFFKDEKWAKIAEHGILMAQTLQRLLEKQNLLEVVYPVEANSVFVKIPKAWVKPLRSKYFFYIWDETEFVARWMCSFDTMVEDLEGIVAEVQKLSTSVI
ncbi:MAG: threonine aldolase [Bdellovibrionales bacterium CG10_big_fil_rev_8_21_14_0_10_45_34]|nr:MAG: threonine aldolase [Bdellovibrionales bacterium CG10_big_fil_rev_8_21_14_0_10_45_34]